MTYLGLDLGGSHASCSLIRDKEILAYEHLTFADTSSFVAVEQEIRAVLQFLAEVSPDPIAGLGIGFCGLASSLTNKVISTNGKYEDAPAFDFNAWSMASFGFPARVENDARLALRGEMHAGAAQEARDVVMFTLGTGIGGVVAIDGKPLLGRRAQAGVLGGHVPVREKGRACTCGGVGCAEAESGGWALPQICREWPGFGASCLTQLPRVNFKTLFTCAAEGDTVAQEVRQHCLTIWSMMTVAAVHAFDPEVIIFGGGVMKGGDEILAFIRDYVKRYTWTCWDGPLVRAALGDKAAALGVPTLFHGEGL